MIEHYSTLLDRHGPTMAALEYRSEEQQIKRYSVLAGIGPMGVLSSVLDVGCGLGHLCDFLRRYGWNGAYTGIDINPTMVASARERLPKDEFMCVDMSCESLDRQFDYVFCGATVQHRPRSGDPIKYMEEMVTRMFAMTKIGLAFDVFSNRVEFTDDQKLYVDPSYLVNFCLSLTRRYVLRNDYRPYEIVVYLYKNVAKNDLNIFTEWIGSEPRIIK